MFEGIYGYFFGNDASQSTVANVADTPKDANEWIVVDHEMEELNDDESVTGEAPQLNGHPVNRQRLRKLRKEIANQTKKQQVRDLNRRRQEVEKKLFEDSSGDSSSVSSSPLACTPPIVTTKLEGAKPVVQRKKKCGTIKQPKGSKGDNRRPNNAK